MAARSLTERVEILEQKVEELQELPVRMAAVESQILQLRGEMHDGFSAINQRFEGVNQRFDRIDQRFEDLERRVHEGDEETRRYMRVLHEEVLARFSLLEEGRGRRKR